MLYFKYKNHIFAIKAFIFVSLNRELIIAMRRFSTLWSLVAILCMAMLPACSQDNKEVDKPTEVDTALTLSTTSVEAAAEGGPYSVDYTLTGGLDGIGIHVACVSEWVTDITTTEATISFTVATNSDTVPRVAKLTVRYPGIENQTITVTQLPGESYFDMMISNATSASCQSTVVPKDSEMAYVVQLSEMKYFWDMGISTSEQLFDDDKSYFQSMANGANLGQFMIINQAVFYGQSDISWTGMTPNIDYVLYAYGIEFNEGMTDYTMTTPIGYLVVRLESGTLRTVEFDVNVTVDGPVAHYDFEPIDWDGSYYIDIYAEGDHMYIPEGEEVNDVYTQTVVNTWLEMMNVYFSSGFTSEQLVNIMCLRGHDSYSEERKSNTKYMMLFYAIDIVDGIPQVVSRPFPAYFQTEEVKRSDMTFDVDLSGVYTRVADIRITPSKNTDPYTVTIVPTSDIPSDNPNDIMLWLTTTYRMPQFKGEILSHVNNLEPESHYSLLIFGYYGGVFTTDLTRLDFTTDPVSECENSVIRVDFMGPYSAKELAQHMPDAVNGMQDMYEQYGYYILWAEIITEKPSQDVFIGHFEPSEFDEGSVFEDLVAYASTPVSYLTARSGVEFYMCGVTMDYRGNYSEMWKSELFSYEYNANTKRPIEELLAKLEQPTTSGRLMVVAPDATEVDAQSLVLRME